MKFDSKRDIWIRLLIWISVGGGFINTLFAEGRLIKFVMLLTVIFVGWLWFGTNYGISKGILKIKCGPFKWYIPIKDIKSIKKTRNPLSSPALSIERLQIRYGYSSMILISPKDRDRFIELITKENGNIIVDT
ncbi:PH domain-containing protein [Alkaliphilus metalliredigens]|nr:PH domain-containing protein [Alkaliphilus metalliredigens]